MKSPIGLHCVIKSFFNLYFVIVTAYRSDNDETLLLLIFITLTKTRQQNEEYYMVKLQVKTDNIR